MLKNVRDNSIQCKKCWINSKLERENRERERESERARNNTFINFGRVLRPKMHQTCSKIGAKNVPKIAQNPTSAPQGRPEASREPFGTNFRTISSNVGAILEPFWTPRGIMFKLFRLCLAALVRSSPPSADARASFLLSTKTFEKAIRNHLSKLLSRPL